MAASWARDPARTDGLPAFDNSAVNGSALGLASSEAIGSKRTGEQFAGPDRRLRLGVCVRITTGMALPAIVDMVAMKDIVDGRVHVTTALACGKQQAMWSKSSATNADGGNHPPALAAIDCQAWRSARSQSAGASGKPRAPIATFCFCCPLTALRALPISGRKDDGFLRGHPMGALHLRMSVGSRC